MTEVILNFITGALLLNIFIPYLTIIMCVLIWKKAKRYERVTRLEQWLKVVLILLLFIIVHVIMFFVSMGIMYLCYQVTGIAYWAA